MAAAEAEAVVSAMECSSFDPGKLMAAAEELTKISFTRWSPDWKTATILYEQAGIVYKLRNEPEKAKNAFEKASEGQEMSGSPLDAAKHLESAGALAIELGLGVEISNLYRRASEFYRKSGNSESASRALAVAARALEVEDPEEALELYDNAYTYLEEEGKGKLAFNLYIAAANVYLKLEKYSDAAGLYLRLAASAKKLDITKNMHNGYISAIIIFLYATDLPSAQACYSDCLNARAFRYTDQYRWVSELHQAYEVMDLQTIKRAAQSNAINHLDHVVIGLARKLPGDLYPEPFGVDDLDEDDLDEDDLR